jgi:CubicO group peptidase (beta-lactamase class C family)
MDIRGYIIEKLSGQSLPDFMEQHIFKPLGMRDAGFLYPAANGVALSLSPRKSKGELARWHAGLTGRLC